MTQKSSKNVISGPKMVKNGKDKNFWSKNILSESIQNVLKGILKSKSRNRKLFPVTKFYPGTLSFFGQNGEKMANSTIFGPIFSEIDSGPFETLYKTKISRLKCFRYKNFSWPLLILNSVHQSNFEAIKRTMILLPSSESI